MLRKGELFFFINYTCSGWQKEPRRNKCGKEVTWRPSLLQNNWKRIVQNSQDKNGEGLRRQKCSYPDSIITCYIHTLNYHTLSYKDVQILYLNNNNNDNIMNALLVPFLLVFDGSISQMRTLYRYTYLLNPFDICIGMSYWWRPNIGFQSYGRVQILILPLTAKVTPISDFYSQAEFPYPWTVESHSSSEKQLWGSTHWPMPDMRQ
jgi:hypothetical protein